jgi:acetylornithine deacetylase
MSTQYRPNKDRLLAVAAGMVPFPSFTGQESELADWVADQAGAWGGRADLMEVEPGRRQVNMTFKGRKPGRTLALNGHLDIDPLAAGWKRDPWKLTVEGNIAYGAGMFNMRGGLCSMVEASQILRDLGGLEAGELVLSFVAGHLQGGIGTQYLLDRGDRPDAMINPEPWGAHNVITVCSGVTKVAITTYGYSTHTSSSEKGINAIEHMSRVIERLAELTFQCEKRADMPYMPRTNLCSIIGGRGENYDLNASSYVADRCSVIIDVRYLEGQTVETIERDFRTFLDRIAQAESQFRYSIEQNVHPVTKVRRLPHLAAEIPQTEEIVQLMTRIYQSQSGNDWRSSSALVRRL